MRIFIYRHYFNDTSFFSTVLFILTISLSPKYGCGLFFSGALCKPQFHNCLSATISKGSTSK